MDQLEFLYVTSLYGALILFFYSTYFIFKHDDPKKPFHPANRWLLSILLLSGYHFLTVINFIIYINTTSNFSHQTPLMSGLFSLLPVCWYYFIAATVRKVTDIKNLKSRLVTLE